MNACNLENFLFVFLLKHSNHRNAFIEYRIIYQSNKIIPKKLLVF